MTISGIWIQPSNPFVITSGVVLLMSIVLLLYLCYHGGFTIRMPCGSLKCLCENTQTREGAAGYRLELGVRSSTHHPSARQRLPDVVSHILNPDMSAPATPDHHITLDDAQTFDPEDGAPGGLDLRATSILDLISRQLSWMTSHLESQSQIQQMNVRLITDRIDEVREELLGRIV